MQTMSLAENSPWEMRVTQLTPSTDWALWKKLHTLWVAEELKSEWYMVYMTQSLPVNAYTESSWQSQTAAEDVRGWTPSNTD